VFAKSCVFTKQSFFPILCSISGLFLDALLRHFAEFLKDYSSLTFVFSTCLLVSDWYSFLLKWLFLISTLFFSHRSSLFRALDLGAVSFFTPLAFRSILFFDFFVTHICIFSFDSLRIVLLPLFSPSFGADLCHLYSRR